MSIFPFRAVLFDFDGTLADSYGAIAASINHVRSAHGLPPLHEGEVRRHVGRGLPYLLEHTVPGGDQGVDQARYHAHHPSVMRPLTRLLPGAADLLQALKRRGIRLAVCSNKPSIFTCQLLAYLGVDQLVEVVLGPEDVPHAKPAPDMLRQALLRLQIATAEALYVGDMGVDVETARRAGVTVWVVPTGSETRSALEAAAPDRLVADLHELLSLIS